MAEKYTDDELAQWFREKAVGVKTGAARNRLLSADEREVDINNEFVGGMYFFRYDPKHKLTLTKYDKYPLVIVVERYNDGFLGLNMHYMSSGQRKGAITMMNDFYSRKKPFSGVTTGRGLTNWELLINTSSGIEAMANKTVHRYLYNHIRSRIIRINKDEYDKAIQLPIDEWVFKR